MPTEESYGQQLSQLAPRGKAIPKALDSRFRQLLFAVAFMLARVEKRARDLLNEFDPRTTVELLPEWERLVGLPDPCTGPAETLQERRARVVQKLNPAKYQNLAFYQDLATRLGYVVTIQEFIPMESPFLWRVTVTEPRITFFRCGQSRCGDRLRSIERADDLECLLFRLKPAHTTLEVAYTGA